MASRHPLCTLFWIRLHTGADCQILDPTLHCTRLCVNKTDNHCCEYVVEFQHRGGDKATFRALYQEVLYWVSTGSCWSALPLPLPLPLPLSLVQVAPLPLDPHWPPLDETVDVVDAADAVDTATTVSNLWQMATSECLTLRLSGLEHLAGLSHCESARTHILPFLALSTGEGIQVPSTSGHVFECSGSHVGVLTGSLDLLMGRLLLLIDEDVAVAHAAAVLMANLCQSSCNLSDAAAFSAAIKLMRKLVVIYSGPLVYGSHGSHRSHRSHGSYGSYGSCDHKALGREILRCIATFVANQSLISPAQRLVLRELKELKELEELERAKQFLDVCSRNFLHIVTAI